MTENNDSPKINMSNTKKDMMEAYQIVKKRLMEKKKDALNADKARKSLEMKLAAETADSQAAQDPLERLFKLKGDISRELTELAEKFENEIETYRKIQIAVKEKQNDLERLYEIETAASDLAALIEGQQEKRESFEADMTARKAAFDEEMRTARAEWEMETLKKEQSAKEQAETIKKLRQREKEEYEYAFARKKEQRENELRDELKTLENELAQKRSEFEEQTRQRDAELEIREKAVTEMENEIEQLKKEVAQFPQKLNKEIDTGVAATTERLTSDFEKSKALIEAQYEGQKNVLTSRIEALEKLVKNQEVQMAKLSERHEQAYEKVQDIANRAVEAAKREYISVPVTQPKSSEKDQ